MFRSKSPKRRERKKVEKRIKGRVDYSRLLRKLPIYLIVILLLGISFYFFSKFQSFNSINIDDSLSKSASERILIEREGVESTLYVFEAPIDNRILAAWVVIKNMRNGSTVVYYVPAGVYIRDYSGQLDDYVSVADLRYAGNVLSETRDIEYAVWQINNLTSLSIDSYIWIDSEAISTYSTLFGDLSEFSAATYSSKYINSEDTANTTYLLNSFMSRFSLFKLFLNSDSWESLSKGVKSNLSPGLLVKRIVTTQGTLNSGGVYLFDLSQPWATEQVTTSNGKTASILNSTSVDNKFAGFIDIVRGRDVEREQVKVEVYNGSGISGLASRYARKVKNSGMTIVRFENAPEEIDRTVIYVPKPENYSNSLKIVKDILVVDAQEVVGRPSFITTGDIVVILGKDMEKEVSWK